jgi:hypothetical protein
VKGAGVEDIVPLSIDGNLGETNYNFGLAWICGLSTLMKSMVE